MLPEKEAVLAFLARAFEGCRPRAQQKWDALKNGLATMKPAVLARLRRRSAARGQQNNQVIAMLNARAA